jgi:hypothetical protein
MAYYKREGKSFFGWGGGLLFGHYRALCLTVQVHLQTQQGGRKLGVISQTIHIGNSLLHHLKSVSWIRNYSPGSGFLGSVPTGFKHIFLTVKKIVHL